MTDQLKAFLRSLLYQLVNYRIQSRDSRGDYRDWANWGRISGRIDLAAELGLLTHDQWVDLHRLLSSASDCLGKPFPHPANAGPCMPLRIAYERRKAAPVEARSPVQAAEPAIRPSWLDGGLEALELVKEDMTAAEPVDAPFLDMSDSLAICKRLRPVKPQAQVLANEPEQVSAPASSRDLRLLCLLVPSRTGGTRSLPVHTLRPVPPCVGVQGRWNLASETGFHLRETQATTPSPEVLEHYLRLGQADAFRAYSRAVRTGVSQ